MKNGVRLVAGAAVLLAVLPAATDAARVAPRQYNLRMDGYVGPPPEGRREMANLRIRASGKDLQFQVTAATVLTGNALPANIFSRVRPYRPNFILRGPREVIAPLAEAEPGARFRIVGRWRSGSQDLLVSSIEPRSAEEPARAP